MLGVAAGVMALVIALAINNGFRNTLQRNLLGAMAHVNVHEKEPGERHRELARADGAGSAQVPHVTAARRRSTARCLFAGPRAVEGRAC